MRRLDKQGAAGLFSMRLPVPMLLELRKRARRGGNVSEVIRDLLQAALEAEEPTPATRLRTIEREVRALRKVVR